jgi:hypothetical protein
VTIIQHEIELIVGQITRSRGHITVDGRNCQGTIVPGMVFTVLSEVDFRKIPGGYAGPSSLIPIGVVDLSVESIWLYGRNWPVMETGMTGRLELVGTGSEQIKERMVISIPRLDPSSLFVKSPDPSGFPSAQ